MHRVTASDMQTSKSRSPQRGQFNENISTRKLGGPQHPNTNYMMQASRFQRAMLFAHENDAGNKNKLGQGPAAYDFTSHDKDNIGKKFAFTIGKVSKTHFQYLFCRPKETLDSREARRGRPQYLIATLRGSWVSWRRMGARQPLDSTSRGLM